MSTEIIFCIASLRPSPDADRLLGHETERSKLTCGLDRVGVAGSRFVSATLRPGSAAREYWKRYGRKSVSPQPRMSVPQPDSGRADAETSGCARGEATRVAPVKGRQRRGAHSWISPTLVAVITAACAAPLSVSQYRLTEPAAGSVSTFCRDSVV
jgi:hypothetical protein